MADDPPNVQIPSQAVTETTDIRKPVRDLLEDLNLLGTPSELNAADGLSGLFKGPPQSVAVIEAGATAVAKFWAGGASVTIAATWGAVWNWLSNEPERIQMVGLGGAAFLTAALVLSIGYVLASDVRGRAAASVSTIEARVHVAETMIRAAETVYKPEPVTFEVQIVPLPAGLNVDNLEGADQNGWRAVALESQSDGTYKYIVVKGSEQATLAANDLRFV